MIIWHNMIARDVASVNIMRMHNFDIDVTHVHIRSMRDGSQTQHVARTEFSY